jgi:D-glycero-alpha-D-manno-heptose-7-phosphate kinase
MKLLDVDDVEIHYDGDLPGQSGLGSSSSFTVCMLHALHALKGDMVDKRTLAEQAIEIEQVKLGEAVGCQDQIAAAFGGLNLIEFRQDGGFDVRRVCVRPSLVEDLEAWMTMFFVGAPRLASKVAATQVATARQMTHVLDRMRRMVDGGMEALGKCDVTEFGKLLHDSWVEKRQLSADISNWTIDEAYASAIKAGAIGGKLLGAGSGGFLLVFRPPEKAKAVSLALAPQLEVGFKLENGGSQIVHYS